MGQDNFGLKKGITLITFPTPVLSGSGSKGRSRILDFLSAGLSPASSVILLELYINKQIILLILRKLKLTIVN